MGIGIFISNFVFEINEKLPAYSIQFQIQNLEAIFNLDRRMYEYIVHKLKC